MRMLKAYPENPCTLVLGSAKNQTERNLMTGAEFSEDGICRYALWRVWNYQAVRDGKARCVMFIMANASKAGAFKDDPTTNKVAKYAQRWGYDGLYIGNLYPRIDTYSQFSGLTEQELLGDKADEWLAIMRDSSALHIAAWGFMGGCHPERAKIVRAMFPELYHLGLSKNGLPKHPLYLSANLEPVLWE